MQTGEELTIEQLLKVLVIHSSNDAGIVLAEHLCGSVEDFAELMNKKAVEIGCTNTHFTNPSGIHDESHYSTAHDLALICSYAMKNETFRSLVSATSYALPATNKYDKEDRYFTTSNELLIVNNNNRADNYYYKYATGIKTGFTTPAGYCLAASANKDDHELLSIVLGSGQTSDGLSQRYIDTISLFNYGYDNYVRKKIVKRGDIVQTINIAKATDSTKKLDVIISEDIVALMKSENSNTALLPEIILNEDLKAPIKQYDVIGKIKYVSEDITYETELLAGSNVEKSRTFLKICIVLLLIFGGYVYIKTRNSRIRYKKSRKRNYRTSRNHRTNQNRRR